MRLITRGGRWTLVVGVMVATGIVFGSSAGAAGSGNYLVNDYGTALKIRNILPSGEAGTTTALQYAQGQQDPTFHPPHQYDQRAMYDGPTLTPAGQVTQDQM